ncbi:MAG: BrnA antitoxin family protein [Neisseriaceae bacterium]|nr:BrnA antitoxin family protein [Neisseriaceae bacterium]MBQ9258565.1 BrnA antitoxin family protein [Neisseriaceae bacterium]
MKKRDIDEFTDEDLAYARSIDFSNGLTVDEMPFIKAYQEKKGIRKPQRKKIISLRVDEDILTLLKQGGRGYQNRVNNILREYFKDSLAS